MISNLQSARALIQADLNHARKVLDLWTRQVSDLEKALEQIDTVGNSRRALSEQYKGAPRLMSADASGTTRGARKSKAGAAAAGAAKGRRAKAKHASPNADQGEKAVRARKAGKGNAAGRKAGKLEAKYKDPHSDKTWSGRGRRPAWFVGAPEQYLIQPAAIQHEAAGASSTVH